MNYRPLLITVSLTLLFSCSKDQHYPYQNTRLDFATRAEDLVSRMTLEEKVSQLTYEAAAIDHLGIEAYNWWNECLHGVARAGKATVFPQAIGMAATFDRGMVYRMADATSTEARAKYNAFQREGKTGIYRGLTFWSPNINIFRDPRWGRGQETYGEDPYLTGELGVEFIRGLQGNDPRYLKTVATSKHYAVHSGPESLRHGFNAVVRERDFRDTYLPAFRKTVQKGKVASVMCAYNRYMGEPCCASIPLQEEMLRAELGFDGYIVSDCGAIADFYRGHHVAGSPVEAAAMGILGGTDLNCGGQYSNLVEAVQQGLIGEEAINRSVERLMMARMKLGMFDPREQVPWWDLSPEVVAGKAHRALALEMARKSVVLLKNNGTLPLSKSLRRVAVIGPNADNTDVQLGNYNGTPVDPVSVYRAISEKLADLAEVRMAVGCPHQEGLPYLVTVPGQFLFSDREGKEPGLSMSFYPEFGAAGAIDSAGADLCVDHCWNGDRSPSSGLEDDHYSVEWKGYLIPGKTGTYALGGEGKYFVLTMEGDTLVSHHSVHHPNKLFRQVDLEAGKAYAIRLVMDDRHGDAPMTLHWQEPGSVSTWEALEAARWAEHVVMVMGLSPRLEGEEMRSLELEGFTGGDRTTLELPGVQKQLIRQVLSLGRPVTLVLMNGSALSILDEDRTVPAIVEAWYGGESAGTAVADVLFGDYNPAGRLPVTFYRSVADLPAFGDYDMEGRTYRYFAGEVLYPFGYGLSYTDFVYRNLILSREEIETGDSVTVSVEVSNTGERDGEEVVQLYVRKQDSQIRRAIKELRGFERIPVRRGQTRVVTFTLQPEDLSVYDTAQGGYVVEKGTYEILAGPSSADAGLVGTSLTVR